MSLTSGTICDVISPPNDTVSVSALPILMLPPNTILPSTVALPDNARFAAEISPVTVKSPPPVISPVEVVVPDTFTLPVAVTFTPLILPDAVISTPPILPDAFTVVVLTVVEVKVVIVVAFMVLPSMLPVKSNFSLPTPSLFKMYNDSSDEA